MAVRSTQFEHKEIYKGTWMAPKGKTINILIEKKTCKAYQKYQKISNNRRRFSSLFFKDDNKLGKAKIEHCNESKESENQ